MPSLQLENSIVDDRYEVRRRLNHGSYAEIYEAFDLERSRRPVIIKALNTALQGTPARDLERTLVENFQNEAIALDRVGHPNVVRRLGHGTAADLAGTPFHYIVLEYMSGGDLMALCRRKPLTLAETLYYFRQVCEALSEAHARGIIHRDVKPANLLLSADQQIIKITDFGVAKLAGGDADAEVTRVGTDLYAPPEHNPLAEDAPRERLTPSADVYSLAKTIYTAMTGQSPREFARKPITSLPPMLARQPWGPHLLEVLRKATAASPADRYPNARAFWDDFSTLASMEAESEEEQTRVRPREPGRASALLAPTPPLPNFEPHPADGAPRIVVDLGGDRPKPPAPAPAPPRPGPQMVPPKQRPAPPAAKRDAAPQPAPRDEYSYAEDLRDLVGTGWRLRAAILAAILLLCASAAAVYYEVHQAVRRGAAKVGTVTAQQLSLRDGPSMQSNVVGKLPYGTKVRVVDKNDDGTWFEVQVEQWGGPVESEQNDRGWVGSRYVSVDSQ